MEKNKADKEGMAGTFEQDLEKRREQTEQTADSKPLM